MAKGDEAKVAVLLPLKTKRKLKTYCAINGVSMTAYVTKLIEKEMNKVKL